MSALWELVTTASRPQASVSSGTAARLEIASTAIKASEPLIAPAIARTSATTPVDVSEVRQEDDLGAAGLFEARRDVVGARALAPLVAKMVDVAAVGAGHRGPALPKKPCETTRTRSPGEQRFATADSIAPVPADAKRTTPCSVRYTCRRRSKTRASTSRNSGVRWWIMGAAVAARTSGGTGVGPGVTRYRFSGI